MKYIALLLTLVCFPLFSDAQLPVSQVPENKNVLIEKFTGNNCSACPGAAERIDIIASQNPGRTFALANHPPSLHVYTKPLPGNGKDFRVPDADSTLNLPGMKGGSTMTVPVGAVNREPAIYPLNPGGCIMTSGFWTNFVPTILNQSAYVNIAGEAFLHPTTRQLIVQLEAYYTANSPVSSNRVHLALAQSDIIAAQNNGQAYPAMYVGGGDFRHNHALRDFINISGPEGDSMQAATVDGTLWTKTFSYVVPASYGAAPKEITAVLQDLELVAFVSETGLKVINVCEVPITITTSTDIFGENNAPTENVSFVSVYPNPMANVGAVTYTLNKPMPVSMNITNTLGQIVISENFGTQYGEQKYELSTIDLADGVYSVNIQAGESTISKKLLIIR